MNQQFKALPTAVDNVGMFNMEIRIAHLDEGDVGLSWTVTTKNGQLMAEIRRALLTEVEDLMNTAADIEEVMLETDEDAHPWSVVAGMFKTQPRYAKRIWETVQPVTSALKRLAKADRCEKALKSNISELADHIGQNYRIAVMRCTYVDSNGIHRLTELVNVVD